MNAIGTLALTVLDLYRHEGAHHPSDAAAAQRASITLALAVCEQERLYPGPGPWDTPKTGPWEDGFDATANHLADRLGLFDHKTSAGAQGDRRIIYRQTKGGLFRLDQRKELTWQIHSVRRVRELAFDAPTTPTAELQAELDRLAPLDPRD